MAKTPKPPYTSVSDLDAFFARVGTIAEPKPPKKIDRAWVESYGFNTAHPAATPSMLRWLGVINDDGESTGVWNDLRVDGTRQTTLQRLVKEAYKAIYDSIDVESATSSDLRGAFIQAYSIGDPKRQIACFLSLCQHAGIKTAVAAPPAREGAANGSARPKTTRIQRITPNDRQQREAAKQRREHARQRRQRVAPDSVVAITLNVEIPAAWTEEEIRERVAAVARAVASAGQSDS